MRQGMKKISRWLTPQMLFLMCSLFLLLLPVVVSATPQSHWEMPQWRAGDIGGKGSITNQVAAVAFYQRYHVYLTPIWGILAFLVSVGGRLGQFIVALPGIFQDIFFGSVKLLGIYTQLEDQQSNLGKLFILGQQLGTVVFGLTSIVYFTFVIFNGKSKIAKKVMESAVLLFLFIGFVPWGLNKIFAMTSSAITATSKATVGDIGVTLLQNNVVDKEMLTLKNWEVELDSSGVVKNPSQYNQIKSVYGWDPGETLGVVNADLLKTLDEEKKKIAPTDQNYFQNIFKSQLITYPAVKGVATEFSEKTSVGGIDYHDKLKAANYMEANYLRYKVNWLPLLISAVSISAIYILMTLKVGTSAFVTVATTIVAPVLAALKAKSPKKVKEEIGHILSGAYSVFFEFIIVVVAMYMMLWLNSSQATQIIAHMGLSATQSALLKCFFYVGLFFGVLSGVQAIERFIGISTSHQNPLQQLASSMIVAGGTVKGVSALGGTAKQAIRNEIQVGRNALDGIRGLYNKAQGNDEAYHQHFSNHNAHKNEENPYFDHKSKNGSPLEQDKKNQNVSPSEQEIYGDSLQESSHRTEDRLRISEEEGAVSGEVLPVQTRKAQAMEALREEGKLFSEGVPKDKQVRGLEDVYENQRNDGLKDVYENQQKDRHQHSTIDEKQPNDIRSKEEISRNKGAVMEERLRQMESQFKQEQQVQARSQRAQQAAQRLQKRQMAGQQLQSGLQRAQQAAQNHFVAPSEEEEE